MRPHLLKAGTATAPPATDDIIVKAESKLGVTLPTSYTDIIRIQNGGELRYDAFPTHVRTSWAPDHVPFHDLYGIGGRHSILRSKSLIREWGLPRGIVLLSGDGHTWIVLDYRRNASQPQVSWIDCEIGEDIILAETFEVFVTELVRGFHRHVFGVPAPEMTQEAVASAVAPAVGAAFKPSFAPGLVTAERPDLLSHSGFSEADFILCPNDHLGDVEFPEAPDCTWLLSADISLSYAPELEHRLSDVPLAIRKLHTPHFSHGATP